MVKNWRALGRATGGVERSRHSSDALWWVIAGAASLVALRGPDIITVDSTRELVSHGLLLFTGLMVSSFRPQHPWRWAVASFVAFGLGDFVHLGSDPHFPELDLSDMWLHLVNGTPDWVIHALPVLVGAFLGAFLSDESPW